MSNDEEARLEALRHKAKMMRYKKPIAKDLNLFQIQEELSEMMDAASEVQWYAQDDESLVAALEGDEDDAFEFKMAFSDLYAELDRFYDDLTNNAWVPDCFDELFPASRAGEAFGGYLGFDEHEGDYFGLEPYEYSSAEDIAEKRISRLTKKELLEAVGACLKIYSQFVGLKYRYDCLPVSMDILRQKNIGILKMIKAIDEQYEKAEASSDHFRYEYDKNVQNLDRMLGEVPQEYWIQ